MAGGVGAARLFFYADIQFGACFLDDLLSILLGELLVLLVALDGLLNLGDFVLGKVAALVFPVFPRIEIVVGAVGPLADDAQATMFHALNLEDLFQERSW